MVKDEKNLPKTEGIKPNAQAQIGEKLKEVYADIVHEPVPDRFLDLLNQLELSSNNEKKSS